MEVRIEAQLILWEEIRQRLIVVAERVEDLGRVERGQERHIAALNVFRAADLHQLNPHSAHHVIRLNRGLRGQLHRAFPVDRLWRGRVNHREARPPQEVIDTPPIGIIGLHRDHAVEPAMHRDRQRRRRLPRIVQRKGLRRIEHDMPGDGHQPGRIPHEWQGRIDYHVRHGRPAEHAHDLCLNPRDRPRCLKQSQNDGHRHRTGRQFGPDREPALDMCMRDPRHQRTRWIGSRTGRLPMRLRRQPWPCNLPRPRRGPIGVYIIRHAIWCAVDLHNSLSVA